MSETRPFSRLTLNIGPVAGGGGRPVDGLPVILIDGEEPRGVTGLDVRSRVGEINRIVLYQHAEICGELIGEIERRRRPIGDDKLNRIEAYLREAALALNDGTHVSLCSDLLDAADAVRAIFPPDDMPPSSDTRLILAALRTLSEMFDKTKAALAGLQTTDEELAREVQALLDDLAGEPQRTADAVSKALADAGASDDQVSAAVTAAQAQAQALVDKITGVLKPATPPAVTVTPTSIEGTAGQALTGQFKAEGAAEPVTWSVADNPPDILVAEDGTISGTPAAAAGTFKATWTDANGATGEQDVAYSIT